MSTTPFMDDYSSEDYSDHEDNYCFVPVTATTAPPAQVEVDIQAPGSNELQNHIIDDHQEVVVTESVYFDVLPELHAETTAEEVATAGWMEQSIYLAVESYFDGPEAQAETGVAAVLEAENGVEELAVEPYFDPEAHAETGLPTALETETVVEEGDVIGSEALEIVEVGTEVEFVEVQVGTGVAVVLEAETVVEGYEIKSEALGTVEADTEVEMVKTHVETGVAGILETAVVEEEVVEELPETVAADATLNPDIAVEEGDVIGDPSHEAVESECDLEAETKAAEDLVEEEDDFVEEQDGTAEEGDDFFEEERHDVIDREPLKSDCNLQAEAKALFEVPGAFMEEFNYEPLSESDSDLEAAEEPDAAAIAEPAVVSIEMTTFKAQEPEEPEEQSDSDQTSCEESESDMNDDSECYSDAEESDLSEEDGDSDAADTQDSEDSADEDSDLTEEEEDDVVVTFLNSSTPVRSTAWSNSLVPASTSRVAWGMWGKLPVTDTTTVTFEPEPDHSSLRPSFEFLGCRPMLLLQEWGNAVMNVIESLLCELSRIRNDFRRVLGALFRNRETTKHA